MARLGRRFVTLAERFRHDPEFQRAVLARLSPAMLDMLHAYLIDPPLIVPRNPRGGPFER